MDWKITEIPCELCGEHSAAVCPQCGAVLDGILGEDDLKQANQPTI